MFGKSLCAVITLFAATLSAAQDTPSWQWTEEKIFSEVNKVRAGRDLTPDNLAGRQSGGRAAVF